jgi:hypothetical protein
MLIESKMTTTETVTVTITHKDIVECVLSNFKVGKDRSNLISCTISWTENGWPNQNMDLDEDPLKVELVYRTEK